VQLSSLVASWGSFKEDSLSLDEISKYRPLALKLIDEVKFDL
jgi:iron(III) transport system substrate-binding protein